MHEYNGSPAAGDTGKPTTDQAFDRFAALLSTQGARAALADLLQQSDYRYIGIFRFQNGKADAALHYDRLNPEQTALQEVPETATYCCYVRDHRGLFSTRDAMDDPRLAGHPAREAVRAYCGVPIMDPEGTLLGTLCHYDVVPRDPAQLDLDLLLRVASALQQGAHVPPYPRQQAAQR